MRIESIQFKNYKLLRDATLPLEPLTVIVGPNGSGKSTVLEALAAAAAMSRDREPTRRRLREALDRNRSIGVAHEQGAVEVRIAGERVEAVWSSGRLNAAGLYVEEPQAGRVVAMDSEQGERGRALVSAVASYRSFALAPDRIRGPAEVTPNASLSHSGSSLAAMLDQMRDRDPDSLAALTAELARWLPEYDAVLFDTPINGHKTVALRTRNGRHHIGAEQLSSGTLLALGLLAVVHGEPDARLVGIEEPEAGIHPRLLRNVFDALLRMAYPAENGIDRPPRQVIVTTHSPYLLDLFKDIPESVVIADRREDNVTFTRLSDRPDVDEIVMGAPLGESWFTGVLGGVPAEPTPPTVYPANAVA